MGLSPYVVPHQRFADIENNAIDVEHNMTFQQGVSGNPHGNRYRTRHLLNQEFMQALLLHFRKDGKKVIEKVARNQPAAYIKICALLIPKEMKIEHFSTVKDLTERARKRFSLSHLICARNVVADTRHSHVEPAAVVEVS